MSTETEREAEEEAIRIARQQRPEPGLDQQRIRELMHERNARRQHSPEGDGPASEDESTSPDVGD